MSHRLDTEKGFRGFVDAMFAQAKQVLQMDGYHVLMAIVADKNHEIKVVSLQNLLDASEDLYEKGRNEEAISMKVRCAKALKGVLDRLEATGYIMIGETWVGSPVDPKDIHTVGGDQPGLGHAIGPIPRFDPKRREALMVSWEWKGADGKHVQGHKTQFFKKDERGRVVLEEVDSGDDDHGTMGNFVGLLK